MRAEANQFKAVVVGFAVDQNQIRLDALCVTIDGVSNKEANYWIFPSSEVMCAEKRLAT